MQFRNNTVSFTSISLLHGLSTGEDAGFLPGTCRFSLNSQHDIMYVGIKKLKFLLQVFHIKTRFEKLSPQE